MAARCLQPAASGEDSRWSGPVVCAGGRQYRLPLTSGISGYTKILVDSELGHAKEILDTLLRTTIDAVKAPVRVLEPMGDAIMCFVRTGEFLQPQILLGAMREVYFYAAHHVRRARLRGSGRG